jgi:hypothetical protein
MKRPLVTFALFCAFAAAPALACPACNEALHQTGTDSQKAINRAILVLLLPTITLIGGAVGLAYKYRNPREE